MSSCCKILQMVLFAFFHSTTQTLQLIKNSDWRFYNTSWNLYENTYPDWFPSVRVFFPTEIWTPFCRHTSFCRRQWHTTACNLLSQIRKNVTASPRNSLERYIKMALPYRTAPFLLLGWASGPLVKWILRCHGAIWEIRTLLSAEAKL